MCQMAAFLYNYEGKKLSLKFFDMESHSNCQEAFPECSEANKWHEGHYTPQGEIMLRLPDKDKRNKAAEEVLKAKYPTFDALIWGLFVDGDLPYSQHNAVAEVLTAHGVQGLGNRY